MRAASAVSIVLPPSVVRLAALVSAPTSKDFCSFAALMSAVAREVSAVTGDMLKFWIWGATFVSASGAAKPAVSDPVGIVIGLISVAASPGLSCQFQNLVRSIFSADGQ